MIRFFIFFLGIILFQHLSFSQNNENQFIHCGTEPYLSEELIYYQQNLNNYRFLSDDTLYIPIKVHILGTDEGSGYASESLVRNAFCGLNQSFEQVNVQFYLVGDFNYINNSGWYEHENFAPGRNMIQTNNVPGVLNSYVVRTAAGACGYYARGVDGVVLAINCIGSNSQTWAHELGHQLTLPHTFLGWEGTIYDPSEPTPESIRFGNAWRQVERWDGENCRHAGDGFCDTPPDYLSYRWGCSPNNPLGIIIKDPLGIEGNVDGTNIMSYASDVCVSNFSDEQIQAMRMNLLLDRFNLVEFENQFGKIDTTLNVISPQPNQDIQFDNAVIQWNSLPGATEYLVQISALPVFTSPIFNQIVSDTSIVLNNLIKDRIHYLRIQPMSPLNTCEPFIERIQFFATQITSINFVGENNFKIDFQNLISVSQPIDLRFSGESPKELKVSLINMSGQFLWNRKEHFVPGQSYQIETIGFPPGIYLLKAQNSKGNYITKEILIQ
ncbi:MAG: T9SS C-terminal target domain-containing protein [Saprospirales bacterium]|nr:MAG: T9SS C-terminal target domain-containing protein [Saprospirales bacterium]